MQVHYIIITDMLSATLVVTYRVMRTRIFYYKNIV